MHPEATQLVSTHAPRRDTTCPARPVVQDYKSFNPRTPAGYDRQDCGRDCYQVCFNPRTPARYDWPLPPSTRVRSSFNPRTPARYDKRMYTIGQLHIVSTHVPRRDTTFFASKSHYQESVSTHVPRRDTTHIIGIQVSPNYVSTHVPQRDTTSKNKQGSKMECFNPRTPAGYDI